MKLHEAISLIENSIEQTSGRSETKDKMKLINVLKELEVKELTEEQNFRLEEYLTSLLEGTDLNENVRESKKALYSFLNEKLHLTYEGYWRVVGAFTGSAVGFMGLTLMVLFHESDSNYILAPLISMAIGFVIGSVADFSLEKQGRTIRTWP